jgi:hypothetical protein
MIATIDDIACFSGRAHIALYRDEVILDLWFPIQSVEPYMLACERDWRVVSVLMA